MKKIETYTEFMNLWNISHKNRYWGTKKITPEQEADIIERANQKDFKRYAIYLLNDGYHFIVIDTKYTIDSDLYYDDETPTPKITLDYFKAKNQINIKYDTIDETDAQRIKPYYMINYTGNDREVTISRCAYLSNYYDNLKWAQDKNLFVNYLTEEDIKEYNKIIEQLNKEYDERLEKYFKRYNKNIYAIGYWVNR